MATNKSQLEKWLTAPKRHHLSDRQVQMARDLGPNPDKLGKIDNHKQEPWKTPLPQFIEEIYFKRFKKDTPEVVKPVKPLKQILKELEINREKKKKEKERKRKEDTISPLYSEKAEPSV